MSPSIRILKAGDLHIYLAVYNKNSLQLRPGAPPAPHSTCPKSNPWPPSLKLPSNFLIPGRHQRLFHIVLTLDVFFASFRSSHPADEIPSNLEESFWPSPGELLLAPHPTFLKVLPVHSLIPSS